MMEIPSEVLEEILVRLPVKMLLQLRCVSKSWCSLISSPSFISTLEYPNNTTNSTCPDSPVLLRYYSLSERKMRSSLYIDLNHSHPQQKAEVEFPLDNGYDVYHFVASCNGLLCFSTYIENYVQIVLWNCSIRKYIHVPIPLFFSSDDSHRYILGFGFHYQDQKYDFKILRLVYFFGKLWSVKFPPVADVYHLSTNSWRPIQSSVTDTIRCVVADGSSQAFLNEAIHWIGYSKNSKNTIVIFHIGDEVFSEIEVPKSVANQVDSGRLSLVVHNYAQFEAQTPILCLIEQDPWDANGRNLITGVCHMWVMREYGAVNSWIKQFTVDMRHHGGLGRVLGFTERKQILIVKDDEELISYCTGSHSIKSLGIHGYKNSFNVTSYKESLFLLNM